MKISAEKKYMSTFEIPTLTLFPRSFTKLKAHIINLIIYWKTVINSINLNDKNTTLISRFYSFSWSSQSRTVCLVVTRKIITYSSKIHSLIAIHHRQLVLRNETRYFRSSVHLDIRRSLLRNKLLWYERGSCCLHLPLGEGASNSSWPASPPRVVPTGFPRRECTMTSNGATRPFIHDLSRILFSPQRLSITFPPPHV